MPSLQWHDQPFFKNYDFHPIFLDKKSSICFDDFTHAYLDNFFFRLPEIRISLSFHRS
jgi:hypothetical protein